LPLVGQIVHWNEILLRNEQEELTTRAIRMFGLSCTLGSFLQQHLEGVAPVRLSHALEGQARLRQIAQHATK